MNYSRQSPLGPDEIARRVGRTGMRVRGLLRTLYPDQAPGSGARWELTEDQVAEVLAYFESKPASTVAAGTRNPRPGRVGAVGFRPDGLPAEWHWEGHVQAAVIRYLSKEGWRVDGHADTANHERGPDISASRPGRNLLVEVKGYPSVGYRDPLRAGEVKRTNPSVQAQHWYSQGLLKAMRMQNAALTAEVGIALPAFARYEALISETSGSLERLGIGILLVNEGGDVTVRIATRRAGSGAER